MNDILHTKPNEVPQKHQCEHKDYEFFKRVLVPMGENKCAIAQYEVPPGKAAFPYHYHTQHEEAFYILSGNGILKTPEGEREVTAGDFLFFPANEKGAHKLTNKSESEMLVYLDYSTRSELDVSFYPDSNKMGVWGKDIKKVYKVCDEVGYYECE